MPRKKESVKNMVRVSTAISQLKISPHLAKAVMIDHNLKSTDRIAPDKFKNMVDAWRCRPVGGK